MASLFIESVFLNEIEMINACLQVLKVLMIQMVLIPVLHLMASNWTTLQSKTTFETTSHP